MPYVTIGAPMEKHIFFAIVPIYVAYLFWEIQSTFLSLNKPRYGLWKERGGEGKREAHRDGVREIKIQKSEKFREKILLEYG